MAFVTPLTPPGRAPMASAYVRASMARCDKHSCVAVLEVWASAADRQAGQPPVTTDAREYLMTPQVAGNPLEYVYHLIEASGEFPAAAWGV